MTFVFFKRQQLHKKHKTGKIREEGGREKTVADDVVLCFVFTDFHKSLADYRRRLVLNTKGRKRTGSQREGLWG